MAAHTNSAPSTFRDVHPRPCSAPSANNDGCLKHTAALVSLLRIVVNCSVCLFYTKSIFRGTFPCLFLYSINSF